jgi:predicted MFS family arabinose efflux permease
VAERRVSLRKRPPQKRSARQEKARAIRREKRRRRILLWTVGLFVFGAGAFALYTYVIRDLPVF